MIGGMASQFKSCVYVLTVGLRWVKVMLLFRSEARRQQDKKDGVWPTNGRKMEGTLVVIPGGGSVLLPK